MKTTWPLYLIGGVAGMIIFGKGLVFEGSTLIVASLLLIFLN